MVKFSNKIINKNRIVFLLCFLVVVLGALCRLYLAKIHFASCDDFGVAVTILNGMNYSEGWSLLNSIMGFISFRMFHWTYAPLQFVFTSLLLNPDMSFEQLSFWGRIPSVILGVLSIVFIGKLVDKLYADSGVKNVVKIALMILLAFNCECILYSAQMESYEIGVFCVIGIISYFYKHFDDELDYKTAIVMAIFCYSQYQMFVFVFAFYLLIGAMALKKHEIQKIKQIIKNALLMVAIDIPCFAYFFLGHMYRRGVAWNAGINNKYLFQIEKINLGYLERYFGGNLWDYVKYLILPGKASDKVTYLIVPFVLLSVVGLVSFAFEKNKRFYVGIYLYIVIFIFGLLILKGSLTFSPSRHMLVMVPISLLILAQGCCFIYSKIKSGWRILLGLMCLAWMSSFMGFFVEGIPEQIENRKNRVTEEYIQEIMEKYDVLFASQYSFEPYVMLRKQCDVYSENILNYVITKKDYSYSDSTTVFVWQTVGGAFGEEQILNLLIESGVVPENATLEVVSDKNYRWGSNQEYADDSFGEGGYGEYTRIYNVN